MNKLLVIFCVASLSRALPSPRFSNPKEISEAIQRQPRNYGPFWNQWKSSLVPKQFPIEDYPREPTSRFIPLQQWYNYSIPSTSLLSQLFNRTAGNRPLYNYIRDRTNFYEFLERFGLRSPGSSGRIFRIPINDILQGTIPTLFPNLQNLPPVDTLFDFNLANLFSVGDFLEAFPLIPDALPTPANIGADITRVLDRIGDPNFPGIPLMEQLDPNNIQGTVTGVYLKRPDFVTDILNGLGR